MGSRAARQSAALVVVLALAVASGAPAARAATARSAAEQFASARAEHERRHWSDAAAALKAFLSAWPGSAEAEEATFLLAEAYGQSHDWTLAEVEYTRFVTAYAGSPRAPEAMFQLGVVVWHQTHKPGYDQETTYRALEQFTRFLALYPDRPEAQAARSYIAAGRERLAEHGCKIARLYLKLHAYDAARVYLQDAITSYAGTRWADRASLLLAESYEKQGRLTEALEAYTTASKSTVDASVARTAEKKMARLQRRLTQGSAAARTG